MRFGDSVKQLRSCLIGVVVVACSTAPVASPSVGSNPTPSPIAIAVTPTAAVTGAPTAVTNATPSVIAAAAWSRGIYLQAVDPAIGFYASNTRLMSVTRTLQRAELHGEVAWLYLGPWSPDGTAVVGGDRTGASYVIWPDALTKLPQTNWTWLDAATLTGVILTTNNNVDLVRVDARSGQIQKREPLGAIGMSGAVVSPTGDWVAFSTAVPDSPGEAITLSPTQRVTSGPRTFPAGWLPDGRFVFIRQGAVTTVEARDPGRSDATVLGRFTTIIEALAQPSSAVVVVHDVRTNQLWTLRGGEPRAVPLQVTFTDQVMMDSISRDGRTLTFSGPGNRTGTIDLESGVVTYMCDAGCWRLVVN